MTWPARSFTFHGEYNEFLRTADVALGRSIDAPDPHQIPPEFADHDNVCVFDYRGTTGGFIVDLEIAEDNSSRQQIIAYAIPGLFGASKALRALDYVATIPGMIPAGPPATTTSSLEFV
jgi:hypothetical protein